MEHTEILNLWKSYENQLQQGLRMNKEHATAITKMKAGTLLFSMRPQKLFAILIGFAWVCLGSMILIYLCLSVYASLSKFFLISTALQLMLTVIALMVYIYQLVLINQLDLDRPIMETQIRLASLKLATLWVARILFLQLPLWTTFYWSEKMFMAGHGIWMIIQCTVTFAFTFVAIWLFRNISYKNREKKWFRLIFNGKEWTPMLRAIEMLSQLDQYKIENSNPVHRERPDNN